MNHCLLEVEVLEAPQLRYTQDNQTPIAEMMVSLEGLRPDDPAGELKVVGWGNLAQELPARVQVGQRLVIEGRLRMNTVTRQDGLKEKKAEFTLARLHPLGSSGAGGAAPGPSGSAPAPAGIPAAAPAPRAAAPRPAAPVKTQPAAAAATAAEAMPTWNASPLVPELGDDDIPF